MENILDSFYIFNNLRYLTLPLLHIHRNKTVQSKDVIGILLRPVFPSFTMPNFLSPSGLMHFKLHYILLTTFPLKFLDSTPHTQNYITPHLLIQNSKILVVFVFHGYIHMPLLNSILAPSIASSLATPPPNQHTNAMILLLIVSITLVMLSSSNMSSHPYQISIPSPSYLQMNPIYLLVHTH